MTPCGPGRRWSVSRLVLTAIMGVWVLTACFTLVIAPIRALGPVTAAPEFPVEECGLPGLVTLLGAVGLSAVIGVIALVRVLQEDVRTTGAERAEPATAMNWMPWVLTTGAMLVAVWSTFAQPRERLLFSFLALGFGLPLAWLLQGIARSLWPDRFPGPRR